MVVYIILLFLWIMTVEETHTYFKINGESFSCCNGVAWHEFVDGVVWPISGGYTIDIRDDIVLFANGVDVYVLDDVHPDDIIENLNYHASSTSEYAIISAGNWMCKESILFVDYDAPEPWPESLSEISLSFSSAGQSFSRIYTDLKLGSLATYLYYGSTPVYCYGDCCS